MKYMKAMIEAVELQAEDVVLTSACEMDCPDDCLEFDCDFEA